MSFFSYNSKTKWYFLTICIVVFLSFEINCKKNSYQYEEEYKEENTSDEKYYEKFKYYFEEISDEFSSNPYYELGISPWSTFDEIKAKYKILIKKYHPDKSGKDTQAKFMRIQKSFEKIKEKRKIKNDDDYEENRLNNIFTMIVDGLIKNILLVIFLFFLKFFFGLFSRFVEFIWFKCVLFYFSYWIIETFCSHLIRETSHLLVYSFLLTFLLNYLKKKVC